MCLSRDYVSDPCITVIGAKRGQRRRAIRQCAGPSCRRENPAHLGMGINRTGHTGGMRPAPLRQHSLRDRCDGVPQDCNDVVDLLFRDHQRRTHGQRVGSTHAQQQPVGQALVVDLPGHLLVHREGLPGLLVLHQLHRGDEPRPRTWPTMGRSDSVASRSCMYAPNSAARSTSPSRSMMSRLARAAAHTTGCPV